MITLRQLQVFLAIAKFNNVTLAAETIHLSQSAASMALAELEKQLNCELFTRVGKRLLLNSDGEILLPRATQILEQTEELQTIFSEDTTSGSLSIGASTTIGNHFLPQYLLKFKELYPNLSIHLDIGNTDDIARRVLNFELTLGYIEGVYHHADLDIVSFQKDELVVFVSNQHPLAELDVVTLGDLEERPWILREVGSGTRQMVENNLLSQLYKVNIFLEIGDNNAIIEAVSHGFAISCLSRLLVQKHPNLKILNLESLKIERNFYLILHKAKYRSQLIRQWVEWMEAVVH